MRRALGVFLQLAMLAVAPPPVATAQDRVEDSAPAPLVTLQGAWIVRLQEPWTLPGRAERQVRDVLLMRVAVADFQSAFGGGGVPDPHWFVGTEPIVVIEFDPEHPVLAVTVPGDPANAVLWVDDGRSDAQQERKLWDAPPDEARVAELAAAAARGARPAFRIGEVLVREPIVIRDGLALMSLAERLKRGDLQ